LFQKVTGDSKVEKKGRPALISLKEMEVMSFSAITRESKGQY